MPKIFNPSLTILHLGAFLLNFNSLVFPIETSAKFIGGYPPPSILSYDKNYIELVIIISVSFNSFPLSNFIQLTKI